MPGYCIGLAFPTMGYAFESLYPTSDSHNDTLKVTY